VFLQSARSSDTNTQILPNFPIGMMMLADAAPKR